MGKAKSLFKVRRPPQQRTPLEQQTTPTKRERVWAFVNSGLGIFLVGTVIVGSASSIWTQRLECRADFRKSEETFRKALVEYRYRMTGSSSALLGGAGGAATLELWRGPNSPFIFSDYKGRTLADVTIDLLRSFGEVSLVSDLSSFEVSEGGLSLGKETGVSSVGMPLSPEVFAELARDAPPARIRSPRQNDTVRATPGQRAIENIRGLRANDGLLAALETTVLMRLEPSCGPLAIIRRTFVSDNEKYNRQVGYLYSSVARDYERQMITILAIEQLVSPPPQTEERSTPTVSAEDRPEAPMDREVFDRLQDQLGN